MAHSRRQFLRVSVLGLGGVTVASLLAACGGAGPTAVPGKPTESKPAETKPAEAAKPAAPAAAPAKPAESKPAEAAKPADKPAAAAPAFAGGGSLKLLMRSHFVPAFDTWFDKWAAD